MRFYFWLKDISLSEEKGFGLDQSNVVVEKMPLIISEVPRLPLRRLED
jgi:KUP system potassium uptake protein